MTHGGIKAGSLNRKIELYKPVNTIDPSGQEIHAYSFDFEAFAAVDFLRGKEKMQHGREEMSTILANFKIRFTPKLLVTHRIKFNGDFYNIQSFAPMGSMNRQLIEVLGELLDASKIVIM